VHSYSRPAECVAPNGVAYLNVDPEPHGARIFFFTRNGGVSDAPFDSLNVSRKVGDHASSVDQNLALVRATMDDRPSAWVRQVAGDRVVEAQGPGFAGEADALITANAGHALVVAVADCAPVAFVGGDEVAMVHSGWRGTLAGISGKTARRMRAASATVYLGPCIRECCYEVSGEKADRFADRFGADVVSGRQLSLPAAIRTDLEEAGIEDFHDLRLCTGCTPELFFSHRKQGPTTGRNLAAIAKLEDAYSGRST
jgi:YfiH family protein